MLDTAKLNILYVGTLPPHPGGSAIVGAQLLAGLVAQGHQVNALATATADSLVAGDVFASRHPGIGLTRFKVPYFLNDPYNSLSKDYEHLVGEQIRAALPPLITRHHPDVILIGRETFCWHVPDLAAASGIPCVALMHGSARVILSGGYLPGADREFLGQCRKLRLVVTMAQHMAEYLRSAGVPNVRVIPNPVDLGIFRDEPKNQALLAELRIASDDTVVVHASNLKLVKRPLDVVHSAVEALRRDERLVYIVVGDGQYRAAMLEASREKRIADRFRFVGWVNHERVPDFLRIADLVVMPSELETQSLVYLETQSCARTLLASDIPASREVVRDGETGLLFRLGDIEDLIAKTLLAAADPGLRQTIGNQARRAVQDHSLDRVVRLYAELLEQVVAS